MSNQIQVVNANSPRGNSVLRGMMYNQRNNARYRVNAKSGIVQVYNSRFDVWVNSALRKDEWEELDQAIVRAANTRLNFIGHLAQMNLTKRLGGIGSLVSQWNVASAMGEASVSMDGRAQGDADRVDYLLKGVPVPVIYKPYSFGDRELAAARNTGDAIETSHAAAAARVVVEKLEGQGMNGISGFTYNGETLYGLTNHPDRNTGSGSDWGTIGNVISTVQAMIGAAIADNHYGPFHVYAAPTQFNQAKNSFFTDGSGDTAYDRVMRMNGITGFYPHDQLADGECVLVQMDEEVVDLAFVPGFGFGTPDETGVAPVQGVTNIEWMSGDGMTSFHKALTIAVVRVKSRYDGKSGIVHYDSI
jgi:hypothetical protein